VEKLSETATTTTATTAAAAAATINHSKPASGNGTELPL